MDLFVKNINILISKMYEIRQNDKSSKNDLYISKYFIKKWEDKIQVSSISKIASDLFITKSTISKFISKYNLESFIVLKFLFKMNALQNNKKPIIQNHKIDRVISFIENANKIFLMGSGNSGNISEIFYTRLILKNYYSIFVKGSHDQQKVLKKLNENDLIICISSSLKHSWSDELLKNKKNINKIIFTSLMNIVENKKTIVFSYNKENEMLNTFKTLEETAIISKYINEILLKLKEKK